MPGAPAGGMVGRVGAPGPGRRGPRPALCAIGVVIALAGAEPAAAAFEPIGEWGTPATGELIAPRDVDADGAGNTYVVDVGAASVHKFGSANNPLLSWGSVGSGPGEFELPHAIGVNEASGEVYVADVGEFDPLRIRIERFDSNGTFLGEFGGFGTAEGQFSGLIAGIAVNPGTGDVFVAEEERIQRFNAAGQLELHVGRDVVPGGGGGAELCAAGCKPGESGEAEGEFNRITAIATAGNVVYVSESGNHRVSRYTPSTGVFQRMAGRDVDPAGGAGAEFCLAGCQAGIPGIGAGELDRPQGLDVDLGSGRLYVADAGNERVQRWTSGTMAYQTEFGSEGNGDGEFEEPGGLVETGGRVVVADRDLPRMQSFDGATGAFQARFGQPGPGTLIAPGGIGAGPGGIYVTDSADRGLRFDPGGGFISRFGSPGSNQGRFDRPAGVGVAADGTVYVADSGNDRIQRLDPAGVSLGQWGLTGNGNGFFASPGDVAVAADGRVYVADTGNQRIQRFGPLGNFELAWGGAGDGAGQFSNPLGVAVDPAGTVYVADAGNARIRSSPPTSIRSRSGARKNRGRGGRRRRKRVRSRRRGQPGAGLRRRWFDPPDARRQRRRRVGRRRSGRVQPPARRRHRCARLPLRRRHREQPGAAVRERATAETAG